MVLKGLPEERAVKLAQYIIENNATVRQTAKKYSISKSTVHLGVTNWNGWFLWLDKVFYDVPFIFKTRPMRTCVLMGLLLV